MLLFQRLDSYELFFLSHVFPVCVEFSFMEACPLLDEVLSGPGIQLAFKQFTVEIKRRVLSLVLRVEVGRIVIAVEHANYYTKENAYSRHANCAL